MLTRCFRGVIKILLVDQCFLVNVIIKCKQSWSSVLCVTYTPKVFISINFCYLRKLILKSLISPNFLQKFYKLRETQVGKIRIASPLLLLQSVKIDVSVVCNSPGLSHQVIISIIYPWHAWIRTNALLNTQLRSVNFLYNIWDL